MKIVIIGGGKVAYYLVKTLAPLKHKITVIEKDAELCKRIANELNIEVIRGDGTDIQVLSEACTLTHVFIAVTGKDEDNLIACQLAKKNFGVKKTVSKVNNPKNIAIFETLGVDYAVSSTTIIAELIEQEVDFSGVKTLLKIKNGRINLIEVFIEENSPACDKMIKDIALPPACVLISILRDDEVIIPNGFTFIKKADCVIAVVSQESHEALKQYFVGKH